MKNKWSISILAAASLLGLAFTASAGKKGLFQNQPSRDAGDTKEKMFGILDVNRDGKVSENEFVITGLYEIFQTFDLDASGKVSKKEFMEATGQHTIDQKAEWAAMSRGANEITFKQSLRNKVAIKEMQGHFRKVDKAGRGYITMDDLR